MLALALISALLVTPLLALPCTRASAAGPAASSASANPSSNNGSATVYCSTGQAANLRLAQGTAETSRGPATAHVGATALRWVLPYAEPPIGVRRWQNPAPLVKFS